jgi:hypothetical protein
VECRSCDAVTAFPFSKRATVTLYSVIHTFSAVVRGLYTAGGGFGDYLCIEQIKKINIFFLKKLAPINILLIYLHRYLKTNIYKQSHVAFFSSEPLGIISSL